MYNPTEPQCACKKRRNIVSHCRVTGSKGAINATVSKVIMTDSLDNMELNKHSEAECGNPLLCCGNFKAKVTYLEIWSTAPFYFLCQATE